MNDYLYFVQNPVGGELAYFTFEAALKVANMYKTYVYIIERNGIIHIL